MSNLSIRRSIKILTLAVLLCAAFQRSAFADPISVTVLKAVSVSANEIDLSWPSVAGADTYTVRRSQDELTWYLVASNLGRTAFQDSAAADPMPPQPGTMYYYEVKAVGTHSESDWSQPAVAVTSVAGVVAAPHFWRNRISWRPSLVFPGYMVSRSEKPGGPFIALNRKPATTNIFDDTSAIGGHTYFYQVLINVQSPQIASAPSQSVSVKTYSGIKFGPILQGTQGSAYEPDTMLLRAKPESTASTVFGTSNSLLYQSWREAAPFDTISFATPIPNGNYELTLKFAEIGRARVGQRLMDVTTNSQLVIKRFDIERASGSASNAADLRIPIRVTTGAISVLLSPSTGSVFGPALTAILLEPVSTR